MASLLQAFKQVPGIFLFLALMLPSVCSQTPFSLTGQIFVTIENTNELRELIINPSNGAIQFVTINPDLGLTMSALAFRKTDRLLYAIAEENNHLYRIDATGALEEIGDIGLDPNSFYRAGAITPPGNFLTLIGSRNGDDREIRMIDLESPTYASSTVLLGGQTGISDIAYNPYTQQLFGFNSKGRNIVRIDIGVGITGLGAVQSNNNGQAPFYDPFGRLLLFGSTENGVASALFEINPMNGREERITTGPETDILDMAAAPYAVAIWNRADPPLSFPCSEVRFSYSIANASGQEFTGAQLSSRLPNGFYLKEIVRNPYSSNQTSGPPSGILTLDNFQLKSGIDSIIVIAGIDDISQGPYRHVSEIRNLPTVYGSEITSDDPRTRGRDSTRVLINRFDEDSLKLSRFICVGDTAFLDGTTYGSMWQWSTGSRNPILAVSTEGTFILEASNDCQTTVVTFVVTVASCPFTIELDHEVVPTETLPCSEVTFQYLINNESGFVREGVMLIDTLPTDYVTFVDILKNPFGGNLVPGLPDDVIHLEGMTLPLSPDTLIILVEVGDLPPDTYLNQAMIRNLPVEIGPIRFSDYPKTPQSDHTPMVVLGVETDTFYVEEILCPGLPLVLDGRPYGVEHIWFDGTTESQTTVTEPGVYELAVFDGCEPTFIFFLVELGEAISVSFPKPIVQVHIGDSIQLTPHIENEGDTLVAWWSGPHSSISCDSCIDPFTRPFETVDYWFYVDNGICSDSAQIYIHVDKTRRLYAPNVFSPNSDGVNDYFYLSSPDFGIVRSFNIFNRWGTPIYSSTSTALNDETTGWDGTSGNAVLPPAVYIWRAEIEFIDGETEVFGGDIALIR